MLDHIRPKNQIHPQSTSSSSASSSSVTPQPNRTSETEYFSRSPDFSRNTQSAAYPIDIPATASQPVPVYSPASPAYPSATAISSDKASRQDDTTEPLFSPSCITYSGTDATPLPGSYETTDGRPSSLASSISESATADSDVGSVNTQATDPAISADSKQFSDQTAQCSPNPTLAYTPGGSLNPRKRSLAETSGFCDQERSTQRMATVVQLPQAEPGSHCSSKQQSPVMSTRTARDSTYDEDVASISSSGAASPSPGSLSPPTHKTIRVTDLSHLKGLVQAEILTGAPSPDAAQLRYDISAMPVEDVIEMVAALLVKITSTNDQHHNPMAAQDIYSTEPASGCVSTSVLAFHGKNVPTISIHSYLSRVHRYCPTTYEVFLSLLVYFDRMTESVNEVVGKGEEGERKKAQIGRASTPLPSHPSSVAASDAEMDTDSDDDIVDDETDSQCDGSDSRTGSTDSARTVTNDDVQNTDDEDKAPVIVAEDPSPGPLAYFVVDSYNIHRLIIAGVTCASKFFSDVFYTNSRYSKVGGLPLPELNHLEIQFLRLNDFRLFIPAEDLEAYATMLVEFYAREVISKAATAAH